MAKQIRTNATPQQFCGPVTWFEASGGGPNSESFTFEINAENFQLRSDTPSKMFTAMAAIVTASYFSGKPIAITVYETLSNGFHLVNIIRDREI